MSIVQNKLLVVQAELTRLYIREKLLKELLDEASQK
jgi:hypothetical protein